MSVVLTVLSVFVFATVVGGMARVGAKVSFNDT